jgi:hypothetical protein
LNGFASSLTVFSTIEANLLIICASLPTIRQFMRTVAPGILQSIQSSKYLEGSRSAGNLPTLVTIGGISSHSKKKKRGMYESDIMMETLVDNGANDAEGPNGRLSADGSSKTTTTTHLGITKTQTTQVTYNVEGADGIEVNRVRSMF